MDLFSDDLTFEQAKLLIDNKADVIVEDEDGETPLFQQIWKKKPEIVKLLIDNKASVNINNERGWTPLHFVKSAEIVKLLINNKADVNARNEDGSSALHFYGYTFEAFKFLIDNKADVNAKNRWGETPFHRQIDFKKHETAQLLIDNKADVNAGDDWGRTALHFVRSYDQVKFLIDNKADVNAKNKWGGTPLFFVETIGVAKLLINNKADVNAKNKDGLTPLQCKPCDSTQDYKLIKVLIENGGGGFNFEKVHKKVFDEFSPDEKIHFLETVKIDPNTLWKYCSNRDHYETALTRGADPFYLNKRNKPMINKFGKKLIKRINLQYISTIESSTQMSPTVSSLIHRCINPDSIFKFG